MTPGLRDVFAFSWRHWRRYPITLVILGLGIGGKMLAEIGAPLFIGRMIDALTAGDSGAALFALCVILALRLLFVVLHNGGDYVWTYLAINILRRICADAFARVQRYSTEWHGDTFAGSTVRKITRGTWAFDQLGDAFYFHLLPSAAVVLGVIVTMAFHWPEMAAMFTLGTALYCWVSVHMTMGYFAPRRRAAVSYDTKLGGALADAITCNALVKASGSEGREDDRLGGVLDQWKRTHIHCWRAGIDTGYARIWVTGD
ncbi:MAG: ABC transporter transmembrane domain-containing protein [Alphaproteobacteria bacterium]